MKRSFWLAISSKCVLAGLVAASGCDVVAGLNHDYELSSGEGGSGGGGGLGGAGGGGSCMPGAKQACYSGPAGTDGVGTCTAGVQICTPKGAWGLCEGEVVPADEICATPVDDDCDGQVNEDGSGCSCVANVDKQPCYSGPMGTENNGVCQAGTQTCNAQGSGFGPCVGEVAPQAEDCSTTADENCNAAELSGADLAEGCVCVPGTMQACYSGAPGTENVGSCKGGMRTCNPDGFGFGPCAGEVVPVTEDCTTTNIDENCDGKAGEPCPGDVLWSKRAGSANDQEARAVAVDAAGNVIVAGSFTGSVNFGGGTLSSAGNEDIFVTKLSSSGVHQWSKRYGGNDSDYATSVAVNAQGEIFVVGGFQSGVVDFGDAFRINQGGVDAFGLKLDELGNTEWSVAFGTNGLQEAKSVAVSPANTLFVCGTFEGSPNFGMGGVPNGGGNDYFLVRLAPATGAALWGGGFGDGMNQELCSVATDSGGNVVMAVSLVGTVNFGGGALNANGTDVAVAKFNFSGAHLWSKDFGDGLVQDARGVAVDGMDRILITGEASGTIDFGGGVLTAAGQDAIVARLNADGSHSFSTLLGGVNDQSGMDIAVGDLNSIVLTGDFNTSVDYGAPGGLVMGSTPPDAYVVKLDSTGGYIWGKAFAGAGSQVPSGVAGDVMGRVGLVGSFTQAIDFGGGINSHTSMGGFDAFIALFDK